MLIYHGTSVEQGLIIAKDEKLLSPYQQNIKYLEGERTKRNLSKDEFTKKYKKTIEELALELTKNIYKEEEFMKRGMCISITNNLINAGGYATMHESKNPKIYGGLVLGIEMPVSLLKNSLSGSTHLRFIKDILSIETLKEIYLSQKATIYREEIIEAFKKYNPKIKCL